MNGTEGHKNGIVRLPMWMMGGVMTLFVALAMLVFNDRRELGRQIADLSSRVVSIEATRFTEADAARMREILRAYVDAQIRQQREQP